MVTRLTADPSDILAASTKKRITTALQQVIPTAQPGQFNQAMMELGATVCLPNGAPLCEKCPAAEFCQAFQQGRTGEFPVKAPKKPRRIEKRRVYLIFSDRGVALRRRPERGLLAGLWEYPNELEGENAIPAQLGLSPDECKRVTTGKHIFSHIEWHMTACTAQVEPETLPDGWVWADRGALERDYAVPNAFSAFSDAVAQRLGYF